MHVCMCSILILLSCFYSYEIMLSCWQVAVSDRPTFAALQAKFEQMLASECDNAYIDFSINPEMQYYKEEEEPDESKVTSESSDISPPDSIAESSIHSANSDLSIKYNTDGTLSAPAKRSSPEAFSIVLPCESLNITAPQERQECGEERYVDTPGRAPPIGIRQSRTNNELERNCWHRC